MYNLIIIIKKTNLNNQKNEKERASSIQTRSEKNKFVFIRLLQHNFAIVIYNRLLRKLAFISQKTIRLVQLEKIVVKLSIQ